MVPTAIESYAHHCQKTTTTNDDIPDFKMYIIAGVAYLQPMNARARDFILGFDENYQPWRPILLEAYDIDILTEYVKEGKIKIAMEKIELAAN